MSEKSPDRRHLRSAIVGTREVDLLQLASEEVRVALVVLRRGEDEKIVVTARATIAEERTDVRHHHENAEAAAVVEVPKRIPGQGDRRRDVMVAEMMFRPHREGIIHHPNDVRGGGVNQGVRVEVKVTQFIRKYNSIL